MAEIAAAEGGAVEAGRPGLFTITRRKLLILGPVLLLLVGGGAAWFLGFFGGAGEGHVEAAPPQKPAYFLDLPDVTVNLNSAERRASYLKIRIALELPDQEVAHQIEPFLPRILDAFQVYLREVRMSDLDGSAGLYRLKEELRRRINLAIAPAKVDAVLFKEILIQ